MDICIFSGFIAGVSHANPDYDLLYSGAPLRFYHETSNRYDPRAVRVMLVNEVSIKLGYVPRDSTYVFHDAHRKGCRIVGEITHVDRRKRSIRFFAYAEVKTDELPESIAVDDADDSDPWEELERHLDRPEKQRSIIPDGEEV